MSSRDLHIKVCGIKNAENYEAICDLNIDMVGFNFYPDSKRFVETNVFKSIGGVKRVGVFVKASIQDVIEKVKSFELDYVQLHGDESSAYCKEVQSWIPVIKVFRVDEEFDMNRTKDFEFCDYFLFDTKVEEYGGSGQKFQWEKLEEYKGHIPFFLSGGIGSNDVNTIKLIRHNKLMGLDVNSGFEINPGLKNVELLKDFVNKLSTTNDV